MSILGDNLIFNIDTLVDLKAQRLAQGVKEGIDAGNMDLARQRLGEGLNLSRNPRSLKEHEVVLTLRLERATIVQYSGQFADAERLAADCVRFADEHFGPRGIQVARARLRHNFALEAKREFSKAMAKNLELEDELVHVSGSDALRLNCLTRAIACAVKNADRNALPHIGYRSEPIRESFDPPTREPVGHNSVLRWHYFWCAIASLRQDLVADAATALRYADGLGPRTWRWKNASDFALGHALTLRDETKEQGRNLSQAARADAEKRGFHGLIGSIDAGISGPDL